MTDIASAVAGKRVVVTGAGGSIGSQLCGAVAPHVGNLTLVSLTESALYNVERKLRTITPNLTPILGSVLDDRLMLDVCEHADIVIHAAAHKHVPICEGNPIEAAENNVLGTYTLAMAAAAQGVEQFVLISTDKAVRPESIMGATKRMAELIVRAAATQYCDTDFLVVRFGNVLDSFGSVLPLWREQIANGGPVTITDPACTRYFMSIAEAVELILGVLAMRPESGTFVFDMGQPRLLIEMARELIGDRDIPIDVIGLRPGEKLEEQLHFGGEMIYTEHPKIMRVEHTGPALDAGDLLHFFAALKRRDRCKVVELLRRIAA